MNCRDWQLDISVLLDGELEVARRLKVYQHVEKCPSCAHFMGEQAEILTLLTQSDYSAEPSAEIWPAIQNRIVAAQASRRDGWAERLSDFFRIPQLAYSLAASALLLLTGFLAVRTQPSALVDSAYLAQLEAYSLQVEGNPFLSEVEEENPFLTEITTEPINPFRGRE